MDIKYLEGEELLNKPLVETEADAITPEEIEEKYLLGDVRIVTEQARYPLNTINSMVDGGMYNLNPQFQRRHRWNRTKQSRLIESFIMNVPIPPIFLYEDDFAKFEVMDGLQRLTAIYEFYKGDFKLQDMEYWKELNGYFYNELPTVIRRAIDRRYLSSIILLKETAKSQEEAERMKMIVFDRINSGGIRLEYQESRNAKFQGTFNNLVEELSRNYYLRTIYGVPVESDYADKEKYKEDLAMNKFYSRMQDNEHVLRFFAMRFVQSYDSMPLNVFLDKFAERANGLDEQTITQYKALFEETIELVYTLFGNDSFCQWRRKADGVYVPFSIPSVLIYDPLMQSLSQLLGDKQKLIDNAVEIKKGFAALNFENRAKFYGRDTKKSNIIERTNLYYDFFKGYIK